MSNDEFNCWLAGYFDGEGCIYVPKVPGIELSVSSVTKEVILAVRSRLGIGSIYKTLFDRPEWKTKYSLRVRTYQEARVLLDRMFPFLTIKREKAVEALAKINSKITVIQLRDVERRARNEAIVKMVKLGFSHKETATKFKICRASVTLIVNWVNKHGNIPMPRKRPARTSRETAAYKNRMAKRVTVTQKLLA